MLILKKHTLQTLKYKEMKHLKELFILERSDLLQVIVLSCLYNLLWLQSIGLTQLQVYTIVKIPCTLYYGKSLSILHQTSQLRRSHLGWVTDVLLKMATSFHFSVIQRWNNPQKNHRQLFRLPRVHQCGILLIVSLNDCLQLLITNRTSVASQNETQVPNQLV